MPWTSRRMFAIAFVLAFGLSAVAFGQRRRGQGPSLPQPYLQSLSVLGVGQGSIVDLTIRGADLEGTTSLWFDHPGLHAFHLKGATFRVVASPATPLGHHDIRVVSPFGVSNARTFVVGDRPESIEAEPNNIAEKANPVALNTVVNGEVTTSADIDCFAIIAKKDQRLLIDLEAEGVESRLDATLRLLGPDGRELVESRDFHGPDPFLDVTIPADGRYVVKIHDVIYRGSTDHSYRLTITDGPHLDAIIPALARAGETSSFTLIGRNLGGTPAPDLVVDGRPLERKVVSITAPVSFDHDASSAVTQYVSSSSASRRGFTYVLSSPSGSSNPIFIAEALDPIVVEAEPNSDPSHAQIVGLPCDISGTFGVPGDIDLYRFKAKKGEVFWIDAQAERLGSQADPSFRVQRVNEKGEVADLASGEDTPDATGQPRLPSASVDASLRWMTPEDGLYQVAISDLYESQRGDPRLAYRLTIRPERPDFHLFLLPDSLTQPDALTLGAGGRALAYVTAVRADGFLGPIRVQAVDLPEGVRCEPVIIPTGQTSAPVVFEAEESAKPILGTARLVGRGRMGDRKDDLLFSSVIPRPFGLDLDHEAVPAGIIWPPGVVTNDGPVFIPVRLTHGFIVKVVDAAPFILTVRPGIIPATVGGLLSLDLAVKRRAGFTEAVTVTPVANLPGDPNASSATIAKTTDSGSLFMIIPKGLVPGVYTLVLQGAGPYPFNKDPAAKEKPNVNLSEPSNPIIVFVRPAPVTVAIDSKGGSIKASASLEISVTITRGDGKTDPLLVTFVAPAALKLSADPVTAAPGKAAKLIVKAAADSPLGTLAGVALRVTTPVRGESVDHDEPLAITIAK